jgi:hypothetical protein
MPDPRANPVIKRSTRCFLNEPLIQDSTPRVSSQLGYTPSANQLRYSISTEEEGSCFSKVKKSSKRNRGGSGSSADRRTNSNDTSEQIGQKPHQPFDSHCFIYDLKQTLRLLQTR